MSIADRFDNDFKYHAPTPVKVERHKEVRDAAHSFALLLAAYVPESRELSLAVTALEETVFWANAGIARYDEVAK